MIVNSMKGSRREILMLAIEELLRLTKLAESAAEAAYLPTMAAGAQYEALEEAKRATPPVDSVGRTWEVSEIINNAYRNALTAFARQVDKIRKSERERLVDTHGSEEMLDEIIKMLRSLGDERNLEAILRVTKNRELVERDDREQDPRQLEIPGSEADPIAARHAKRMRRKKGARR